MYSSYTAASFARKHDLADKHGVNLEGALTWAFEFEDQPYFAGFRVAGDATASTCRCSTSSACSAKMSGQRLAVESDGAVPLDAILQRRRARRARRLRAGEPGRRTSSAILVWHYHDDDLPGPDARRASST